MGTPAPFPPGAPPPRRPWEYLLEGLAWGTLLYGLALLARDWSDLPARIPRHFNGAGEVDAWGTRTHLLGMAAMDAGLFLVLSVFGRYPHKANIPVRLTPENAERQYRLVRAALTVIKWEVALVFTHLILRTMAVALNRASGMGAAFAPALLAGSILTIVGYFLLALRAR